MKKQNIHNLSLTVRKNGNSSYITLPKSIIDMFYIEKGEKIEVSIRKILYRDSQEVR